MMIHLNERNQKSEYKNQSLVIGNRSSVIGYWLPITGYRLLITIVGILLIMASSSVQAKEFFDPWELGPFIEGDKVPPKDMAILFKGASNAPEGSTWYEVGKEVIIKGITEVSNGLITAKMYGGGLMGEELDTIRKMRMGQLHWLGLSDMGLSTLVPEMCVMRLSFLFDWEPELYYNGKYCEVDYILEKLEPTMAKLNAKHEVQFLGMVEAAFVGIGSKIPIEKIEDLHRLKVPLLRGDRMSFQTYKAIGVAKIVSVEIYNIGTMASTGMIDTIPGWWYGSVITQWWPHVKYFTDYPLVGYVTITVVVDKPAFERVLAFVDKWGPRYGIKDSRDFVRKFLEITDRGLTKMRFAVRQDNTKSREVLIKRGIKEVHFPESELAKLKEKTLPLYDELADKLYPKWFLDEILKYREEYRKLKAEGKLAEFHETGILPGGNQFDQWRTQWEPERPK